MGAPPQIVVVCEIREDFEVVCGARAAPALLQFNSSAATMAASATPTPRLLHYMFLSLVPPGAPPRPANLSRAYDYWLRSCVRANPAYKIVLWTRDDCDRLIATRHPKYAQFYNETLGAMGVIRQADFCRVAVLATHGGVYLDFDFLWHGRREGPSRRVPYSSRCATWS